jgi:hypothetical protein
MKKYVVVAPHPDDELIGCYHLFRKKLVKKVLYYNLNRMSKARQKEAVNFCKDMGVEYNILTDSSISELSKTETYLIPFSTDHHPEHKWIHSLFKHHFTNIGFYSIDMNNDFVRELDEKDKTAKKRMLDTYFPSQKSLWKSDWKYWMFEGIVEEI